MSGTLSLRKYDNRLRKLERVWGVVGVVGLCAATASVAHAQGSEPRLLVPAPGSTVPSAPLPGGAVTGLALPVAHRLVGSLLLGAAVVLALRASAAGVSAAWPAVGPRLAVVPRGTR